MTSDDEAAGAEAAGMASGFDRAAAELARARNRRREARVIYNRIQVQLPSSNVHGRVKKV